MSYPSIRRSVFARTFLMWLLLCLGMAAELPGQSQTPARPKGTDTRFVDFIGMENRWNQACSSPGHPAYPVQSYDLPITRVVGSDNAINADGYLTDPDKAIQNGVISKYAELKVRIWENTWDETRYRALQFLFGKVRINGTVLKGTPGLLRSTGSDGWTRTDITLWFPSRLLKFPARKAPAGVDPKLPGWVRRDPPEPRVNRIEFLANTAALATDESGIRPLCGPEIHEWSFYPMSLSFDAMAPIVLVHGNDETPRFFQNVSAPPNRRFDFERTLREQMLPYSLDVFMPTNTVQKHADALQDGVPGTVRSFGSRNFHVIAHSKGGLDTRAYLGRLKQLNDAEQGVDYAPYSATTLASPHHGSPGADYRQAALDGAFLGVRAFLAQIAVRELGTPEQRNANRDLTTASVAVFNRSNTLPTVLVLKDGGRRSPIRYRAISGDANQNNSAGPIWIDTEAEVEGLGIPRWVGDRVYELMGTVQSARAESMPWTRGNVMTVVEVPTASFQDNDVAVPKWSAQGFGPFVHHSHWKRNHASIADPVIASEAATLVRQAQPLRMQQ